MKSFLVMSFCMFMSVFFVGCGNSESIDNDQNNGSIVGDSDDYENNFSDFVIGLVTDMGGVTDQSFNQSAWEGATKFSNDTGAIATYIESQNISDFGTNLDILRDRGTNIIWGLGFLIADDILRVSMINPEQLYGIIDSDLDGNVPENVIAAVFKDHEPSFLAGYMAGMVTETDRVGFIGGVQGIVIDRFENGFKAGVQYAANELGKDIEVDVQYINSFVDEALGRATATTMYGRGVDVIFHATGNAGQGVIEAARELDQIVIGVDMDQSFLAPQNVMTSTMKNSGDVVYDVSMRVANGEDLGGQTLVYGLEENGVGLAEPNEYTFDIISEEIFNYTVNVIANAIKSGEINVPQTPEEYDDFINSL